MGHIKARKRFQRVMAASLLLASASIVQAQRPAPTIAFDIPSGPLHPALIRFAAVTGQQLLYAMPLVAGRHTAGVQGLYAPGQALDRLLAGSGLIAERVGTTIVVLKPARAGSSSVAPVAGDDFRAGGGLAVDPLATGTPASRPAAPLGVPDAELNHEIVVTGTHIRGRNPGSPPVQTITPDDMRRNGYATVAQALQALPGNFAGMATEQSTLALADRSASNLSLATGVNLHGLGAGATLVLINGRRIAGSGTMGAFSDISSIPTGAVERIEVLADGASAIYGSDAVGGVVNILLKRRADHIDTAVRLGSVTAGGKRDVQADLTMGHQWGTGGALLAYEYSRSGALASDARDYAASADSRRFGGRDHRYFFSSPGNILGFDPATGGFGPAYAIPPGQDGTALTPQDFLSGSTNLENFRAGTDLIPRQTRHSLYASLEQDVGAAVHLSLDGSYSHRAFRAASLGAATILTVTPANPWFVSPTGAPADLIAYSFGEELGPSHVHGRAEAYSVSGGLDADLGSRWKLRSYLAFAQERERSTTDGLENDAALSEALGTSPDDANTAFNTTADGFFNPYGDGYSNTPAMLAFVGSGYTRTNARSRVATAHVDADGVLLDLPGGPIRVALGGDIRRESFLSGGTNFLSTDSPVATSPIGGHRFIEAGFAELHVPLFGTPNARTGLRSLDLSVAGRIEHYDDFGTTTNPKIGLSWQPIDGVALRSSYGTSFRAPNLRELQLTEQLSTTTLPRADGSTIAAAVLSGGNVHLHPEKARSWTLGLDVTPVAVPRVTATLTWFHTDFRQRIAAPLTANIANALIDPSYAPFVDLVSPATNPADLARVSALLADPTLSSGATLPATAIGAIVDSRYVNTGRLLVSGLDATVAYQLPLGRSRLDLVANGTWLQRYREEVTPSSASVSRLDQPGQPLRLRGRMSAAWTRGPLNALVALNHATAYHDLVGARIRSWNSVDLQLGYTDSSKSGWSHGLSVSLAVQNLFNRAPPFYDSPVGAGYDAANADALGRYVSLQISKSW
jgi:outer membrane receptor protein involved in Fe transport